MLMASETSTSSFGGSSVEWVGPAGFSTFQGKATNASALAKSFEPGRRPSSGADLWWAGLIIAALGLAMIPLVGGPGGLSTGGFVAALGAMILLVHHTGRTARQKALESWSERCRKVNSAWICRRCGATWEPPQS